jgi:hypothetical protein
MKSITVAPSAKTLNQKTTILFSSLFLFSSIIALSALGSPAALAAIFGSFFASLIVSLGYYVIHAMKAGQSLNVPRNAGTIAALALVAVAVAVSAAPSFAQSTPVPLEIPTGVIFSETNNWLETFAPIAAIGIGITIALAVLGYLGKMIVSAFKG